MSPLHGEGRRFESVIEYQLDIINNRNRSSQLLSFIQYLNESIRSAQEGESEIVHHLTPTKFSKFHHMSHFGTKQAAREAIKNKDEYFDKHDEPHEIDHSKIYHHAARIKLGNVAHIKDDGENHEPQGTSHSLHAAGHITNAQREQHKKLGHGLTNKHVADTLRKNNIHTVAYTNTREHKGSTSYMITHPSQVRPIKQTGKHAKLNLTKD